MSWARGLGLAAIVGLLALTPASSALARTGGTCRHDSRARGAHVLARSREAVVFSRGAGGYRGCVYSGGRVRKLDVCCENVVFKVAGRFAAYTYTGSAIGDESNKLGVYDLRTGRLRPIAKLAPSSEGAGREIDTSSTVTSFLVTAAGSLAWIQKVRTATGSPEPGSAFRLGPDSEVRAASGAHPRETILDRGNIGPRSLRVTHRHTLAWTRDGSRRTAPIT